MAVFKRLPNGYGSITILKGNRRKPFWARGPAYETEDGITQDTIGYFEQYDDALDALSAHRSRPLMPVNADRIKLSELFTEWKAVAYTGISRQTKDNYNAAYKHLAPIQNHVFKEIRTAQWQFCLDKTVKAGLSQSSLNKVRVLMIRLCDYAVANDIIDKNYAKFTKLPKFEKTEKETFSDLELKTIEEGIKNGTGISDIILFMCYTGWRIQEVCNLTVFDYDRTQKTLTGGVKTDAGKNRTVFIPDKVLPVVEKYAALNGPALFCYETGQKKKKLVGYSTKKLREEFYNTLDSLGIQSSEAEPKRLTPHSTRHTYNSMLNRAGVDTATRMKLMGQVSEQTNQRVYTHTDLDQMKAAVNALN